MNGSLPAIHVGFTTHWDREWIQSFTQYRFRLVNLFDRLLDILDREPEIRFFFDGQTIVLEDYLEVRPDQRERVRAFGRGGRLVFGPWYVLADQFLEGDEAAVRNLQRGFALAGEFGGPMLEGYVPDSFGSIAALPALLNGFGIRHANLGRGLAHTQDRGRLLFRWEWKDGSGVLAMALGYGNGLALAYPDIWDDIERVRPTPASAVAALKRCAAEFAGKFGDAGLFLSVGVDHMEMRAGMSDLLRHLRATTGAKIQVSTPAEFLAAAERACAGRNAPLETVCGEMRGDGAAPMSLQGVLSTDVPLKQANRAAEILLVRVVEPIAAMCEAELRRPYGHFVAHAWKSLLACHPHDSICACSADAVMRDVHVRLAQVGELTQILVERMLEDMAAGAPGEGVRDIAVAFLNTWPRSGPVPIAGWVRLPKRIAAGSYELVGAGGQACGAITVAAHRVHDLETHYATVADLLRLRRKEPDPRCEMSQRAAPQPDGTRVRPDDAVYSLGTLDGWIDFGDRLGWRVFGLRPAADRPPPAPAAGRIENRCLWAEVAPSGALTLGDKHSGRAWEGLFTFEDQADAGHCYDFVPVQDDRPLRSESTATVEIDPAGRPDVLAFTVHWRLPVCLDEGQPRARATHPAYESKPVAGRRSARTVAVAIAVRCALIGDSDRLDVAIRLTNPAIHHRLRVVLRLDGPVPVASGSHFCALPRDWQDGTAFFTTFPFSDYLHLGGSAGGPGLALAAKGLHEAELRSAAGGHEVLVTLCRSVDTIAGATFGVNFDVEHAKVLEPLAFEFCVSPSRSVVESARKAASFATPLPAWASAVPAEAGLPPFLLRRFAAASSVLSCVKSAAGGGGWIIRFFNLGAETDQVELELEHPPESVSTADLSEAPAAGAPPVVEGRRILKSVRPYEIVTLRISCSG